MANEYCWASGHPAGWDCPICTVEQQAQAEEQQAEVGPDFVIGECLLCDRWCLVAKTSRICVGCAIDEMLK